MTRPSEIQQAHILMIGYDDRVLAHSATEDTRARHLRYANAVGHLHMLVWATHVPAGEVVRLGEKLTVYAVGHARRGGRFAFLWQAWQCARTLQRQFPIRLITTQDPFFTALLGLALRRPTQCLQIQNHSDFLDNPDWLAERPAWNRLLNRIAKFVLPKADQFRVVNAREKDKYLALGIDAQKIAILPVSVNVQQFADPQPASVRRGWRDDWNATQEMPVLLWVGRAVAFKNLPMLVAAVARLAQAGLQFRLVLVGDFSQAPEIPRLVAETGLQAITHFAGAIPHEQLPAVYQSADIYLHSSNYEGFGRVLVEAAAAGLPIVATETAGADEILLAEQTALLVPPNNPAAFAEAITHLLVDSALRGQIAQAAQAAILAKFDPQRMSERVVGAWESALQAKKA